MYIVRPYNRALPQQVITQNVAAPSPAHHLVDWIGKSDILPKLARQDIVTANRYTGAEI